MLHVLQIKLDDGSVRRLVCQALAPDPLDASRVLLQGIQGLTFKWSGYWVQGTAWCVPTEHVMSCATGEIIESFTEDDMLRSRPGKHQRLIAQVEADEGTIRLVCQGISPSERLGHCVQLQQVYGLLLDVGGAKFRVDDLHVPKETLLNYMAGLVGRDFPLDLGLLQGGDFTCPALPGTLPMTDIEPEPEPEQPEPEPEPEQPEPEPEPEQPEPEPEPEPEPAVKFGGPSEPGREPRLRDRLLGLLR